MNTTLKRERAHSLTVWIPYTVLYALPLAIAELVLNVPQAVVIISVTVVGVAAAIRGMSISVTREDQRLCVQNFWARHVVEAGDIQCVERRNFWLSPLAIAPNSDVPVIVRSTGRAIPVVVGVGGNRKVDRIINSVGRGDVPDDDRIEPAELWRKVRGRRSG